MAPDGTETAEDGIDAAAIERGRRLFAAPCSFVAGAAGVESLPEMSVPEIAFAGRSNVGKSSLVNALTGRRTLARTSSNPGHTRQLNFFDLDGRLMLVDLPGYGFARASKGEIERWTSLARDYLRGRRTLARVLLLIDSRHGIKPADEETMTALDRLASLYQVVLTKADKPKPAELAATVEATRQALLKHAAAHPEVFVTSAAEGTGIERLRAVLATLASA